MHMYVWYTFTCMCVCAQMCRRLKSGVFFSCFFILFFKAEVLTNLEHTDLVLLAGEQGPGMLLSLPHQRWGYRCVPLCKPSHVGSGQMCASVPAFSHGLRLDVCRCPSLPTWALEIQTQVFMLAWQALHWAIFPTPKVYSFAKMEV